MPATASPISRSLPNAVPLPPDLEGLATEPVIAASRKLSDAEQRRAAAREAVAGARANADAARQEDEAAAEKAARAGRKVPPSKQRVAQEQVGERARDLEAHTNVVADLRRELIAAVLADRETIAGNCERELEVMGNEVREHLIALEQIFARRREVEVLVKAVERDGLEGRDADFLPALGGRRRRDPLVGEPRELVERLRDHFAPRQYKRDDELTAAERAQIEDARSRGQRAPVFERDEFIAWREDAGTR